MHSKGRVENCPEDRSTASALLSNVLQWRSKAWTGEAKAMRSKAKQSGS